MGLDAVDEGLVGAARRDDAPRHLVEAAAALDALARGLADVAVVVLDDVVDVVGVAVGRAHQAEEGLVQAQPLPHHVEVEVAQRIRHQRAVGLDPRPGAGELRPPQEADGAPRPRDALLLDQPVQRAGDLQDRGAAGQVVVGALLGVALEEVRRQDHLRRRRVGPGDDADDVLQVVVALVADHLGVGGDLLARLQPPLQRHPFARRDPEAEFRDRPLLPAPAADAAPGELEVVVAAAGGDADHSLGAELLARDRVHPGHRAFRDDDLALHPGCLDLHARAAADPHQRRGEVAAGTAARQHRPQVLEGGELVAPRGHLPQLADLAVPHLPAGKAHDLGLRQAVARQLIEDVLRFPEGALELLGQPVAVVAAHLHDRVPGGLARGLADDLVDHRLGRQRPVVVGRELGSQTGRQEQEDRNEEDGPRAHFELQVGGGRVAEAAPRGREGLRLL